MTATERIAKTDQLREYWVKLNLLEPLNNSKDPPVFIIKPINEIDKVNIIKVFDSELKKGQMYVELTNLNYEPQVKRQLFMLNGGHDKLNLFYKGDLNGNPVNHVPCAYLTEVVQTVRPSVRREPIVPIIQSSSSTEETQKLMDALESLPDCNLSEKTLRDEACLMLRIPISRKQWLNELIIESNQQIANYGK